MYWMLIPKPITRKTESTRIAISISILINCCPGKAKSLFMFPFSFPHAIILPEKETEPMISPKSIIAKVPCSAVPPDLMK